MNIDYPKEWDDLPKRKRKKKLRELKRKKANQQATINKLRNVVITFVILVSLI